MTYFESVFTCRYIGEFSLNGYDIVGGKTVDTIPSSRLFTSSRIWHRLVDNWFFGI